MSTNLKPADELFSIRSRIKELQAREKELSDGIKAGELEQYGEFTIAFVKDQKTRRFNRKAAEAELGDLSRFDTVGASKVLRLEALPNPDAA